ncbi:hypothetical protein [Litorihabitans aurantiacus]|uniref:Uncharacterized protein n=1 Tax=Litorihabitans aurantiacus TaxID=1930061 RepID=A0AA37XFW0_9MICO|nr:hypothetical protein [Litorihabitans aurantiacus]GMA32743.1 hypothetical protein GCM10025875_27350 [Litorihabitans aurantiacus]
MIAATTTAYVTLDRIDPEDGSTTLRWWNNAGLPVWSEDVGGLDRELIESLAREDDERGWELSSSARLTTVGEGAVLSGSMGAVLMDSTGVTAVKECWSGAIVEEVVVCEGGTDRRLEGLTVAGDTLWSSEDVSLRTSIGRDGAVAIALDYTRNGGDYGEEYRMVDAATGRLGEPLDLADDWPQVTGTAALPILVTEEDRDDYDEATVVTITALDPATLGIAWTTELDSRQYPEVLVAGSRVLVGVERETWTVLDGATGAVVGGMGGDGDIDVVLEDGVLTESYSQLRRVTLP